MKFFYLAFLFAFLQFKAQAQTITVSGQCMSGVITLTQVADENGKVAYAGTGTVDGYPNTAVSIFWIGAPENVWVLAFDGQPYFMNPCNRSTPPSTANPNCGWTDDPQPGACTGASPLTIIGAGTLPVQLTSFTATKEGSQTVLSWTTATENNNKGFAVQRSRDGFSWEKIAFVAATGNAGAGSTYGFVDAAPLNGKNFYRLAQTDMNSQTTFSSVVMIDFLSTGFYSLHQSGNGRYQLTIESAKPVDMAIIDLSGRKLTGKQVSQGVHQLDISQYAKGIYLLQLKKDNQIQTEKLIKQ